MACYRPLVGVDTHSLTEKGRPKYKIYTRERFENEFPYWRDMSEGSWINIPCGKCVGCRLQYAKTWADRCMLESYYHEQSWFCTFTYNQASVPMVFSGVDEDTGEVIDDFPGIMTVRYKDFQDFLKRLRKAEYRFRYYACSEYGGTTMRPHYHAVMFGLDLKSADLVKYKTVAGYQYYSCPTLEKIWENGYVVVTPLTYATAAYTARYCMKKADTKVVDYESIGIEPEKAYMSRRPGLGYQWFFDHDMYEYDYFTLGDENGSRRIYPSRYYDRLLECHNPELFDSIKSKRLERMKEQLDLKLSQSDYDYMEMLEVEESNLLDRLSALSRDRLDTDKEVKIYEKSYA